MCLIVGAQGKVPFCLQQINTYLLFQEFRQLLFMRKLHSDSKEQRHLRITRNLDRKGKGKKHKTLEVTSSTAVSATRSTSSKMNISKQISGSLNVDSPTASRRVSGKKFQLSLSGNININPQVEEGEISFREYCLLGNKWIPMLTHTQRDRIMNPAICMDKANVAPTREKQFCTTTPIGVFDRGVKRNIGELLNQKFNQNNKNKAFSDNEHQTEN